MTTKDSPLFRYWEFALSALGILISMMFLSADAWSALFSGEPTGFYGEIEMNSNGNQFILAKNASSQVVHMGDLDVLGSWVRHLHSSECIDLDRRPEALPASYSLFHVAPGTSAGELRSLDAIIFFKPSELHVLTPAENSRITLQYLGLGVSLLLLGISGAATVLPSLSE